MNKTYFAGVVATAGLAVACGNVSAQASDWRTVAVGPGTFLRVRAEGGPQQRLSGDGSGRAMPGETVHRIVRGGGGEVLFSYDLTMRKTDDKRLYRIQLSPSEGTAPTFASKREVTARADEDLVRVELMENAETHEKIVDVYRLMSAPAAQAEGEAQSVGGHLMKVHNQFFRWVHGN